MLDPVTKRENVRRYGAIAASFAFHFIALSVLGTTALRSAFAPKGNSSTVVEIVDAKSATIREQESAPIAAQSAVVEPTTPVAPAVPQASAPPAKKAAPKVVVAKASNSNSTKLPKKNHSQTKSHPVADSNKVDTVDPISEVAVPVQQEESINTASAAEEKPERIKERAPVLMSDSDESSDEDTSQSQNETQPAVAAQQAEAEHPQKQEVPEEEAPAPVAAAAVVQTQTKPQPQKQQAKALPPMRSTPTSSSAAATGAVVDGGEESVVSENVSNDAKYGVPEGVVTEEQLGLPVYFVHPYYPMNDKLRRFQGDTVVRYTVQPNGTVSNIRLYRSSGSQAMDTASIKALAMYRYKPGNAAEVIKTFSYRLRGEAKYLPSRLRGGA